MRFKHCGSSDFRTGRIFQILMGRKKLRYLSAHFPPLVVDPSTLMKKQEFSTKHLYPLNKGRKRHCRSSDFADIHGRRWSLWSLRSFVPFVSPRTAIKCESYNTYYSYMSGIRISASLRINCAASEDVCVVAKSFQQYTDFHFDVEPIEDLLNLMDRFLCSQHIAVYTLILSLFNRILYCIRFLLIKLILVKLIFKIL